MSEFHIHIDALDLSDEFEQRLTRTLGFWRSNFAGHPEGEDGFEPPYHLTHKLFDGSDFRRLFADVVGLAAKKGAMRGYVEGEFVSLDEEIRQRSYNASVQPPFHLALGALPSGSFRESEIHIAMSRDMSDPKLLRTLGAMGFFSAYMPKSYGMAQIFTAQGNRSDTTSILEATRRYLLTAGGAVECSLKEERIAAWWVSQPELRLPPVVKRIKWTA